MIPTRLITIQWSTKNLQEKRELSSSKRGTCFSLIDLVTACRFIERIGVSFGAKHSSLLHSHTQWYHRLIVPDFSAVGFQRKNKSRILYLWRLYCSLNHDLDLRYDRQSHIIHVEYRVSKCWTRKSKFRPHCIQPDWEVWKQSTASNGSRKLYKNSFNSI